jgi:hypothetical protein
MVKAIIDINHRVFLIKQKIFFIIIGTSPERASSLTTGAIAAIAIVIVIVAILVVIGVIMIVIVVLIKLKGCDTIPVQVQNLL